jgi:hypothetical protein
MRAVIRDRDLRGMLGQLIEAARERCAGRCDGLATTLREAQGSAHACACTLSSCHVHVMFFLDDTLLSINKKAL